MRSLVCAARFRSGATTATPRCPSSCQVGSCGFSSSRAADHACHNCVNACGTQVHQRSLSACCVPARAIFVRPAPVPPAWAKLLRIRSDETGERLLLHLSLQCLKLASEVHWCDLQRVPAHAVIRAAGRGMCNCSECAWLSPSVCCGNAPAMCIAGIVRARQARI